MKIQVFYEMTAIASLSTVKDLCRRDIRKLIFISVQKFYFWPHFIYHPTWPSGLKLHLIISRSPVRILATPFVFFHQKLIFKTFLQHFREETQTFRPF